MRLLLIGPPGAGKGTQASRISGRRGVPAISTGDIFRAHVAAATDLGRTAQEYMNAGEYVPDHITDAMVRDRLAHDDCRAGFVLDGYPRTLDQVKELDRILADHQTELDHVIALAAEPDVLVERLLRRARLEARPDDTEPVIRRRQQVYLDQTAPLLDEYAARGLLTRIDALGDIDVVSERIAATLTSSTAQT